MYNNLCILDESGDTGYSKKSSKYFIVTILLTTHIRKLRSIAKNIHRNKKDKKKIIGLHAYGETDAIKNKLIKKLIYEDINCIVCSLHKYYIRVPDPYMYALEKIAQHISKSNIKLIIIARRDTRKVYNQKIIDMFSRYDIEVVFSNPTKEKALQIVDFYSWCMFSHLEHEHSKYYLNLQHQFTII